ncbi:MAG: hypothetical protein HY814_06470 [Candidatus Riflebacteria bacterium]|nr:hypothetical protein [Candidatus Riflebacteria bacterium]
MVREADDQVRLGTQERDLFLGRGGRIALNQPFLARDVARQRVADAEQTDPDAADLDQHVRRERLLAVLVDQVGRQERKPTVPGHGGGKLRAGGEIAFADTGRHQTNAPPRDAGDGPGPELQSLQLGVHRPGRLEEHIPRIQRQDRLS